MHNSRLFIVVSTIACASLVSFCGDSGQYADVSGDAGTKPDTGSGSAACFGPGDCLTGDCIEGVCVHCSEAPCGSGQLCSIDGKCIACSGESCDAGVIPNPDDGGTGGCVVREDCPSGQICKAGVCSAPDGSGNCTTTEECPGGTICRFGSCTPGCEDNGDCVGNSNGPRCDTVTEQCVPCVDSGDCSNGDSCVNGSCVPATGCTDRSTCGDLACIGGKCAPCSTGNDCGTGFNCNAGKCVQASGCTSDTECHVFTPGHWCNTASGQCEYGCLPGTGAACGSNCCPSGQTCNTSTHACESGNPGGCNNCNGLCGPNQVCNTATCMCENTGGGGCNDCDGQCIPFLEMCNTSTCRCETIIPQCDNFCRCPTGLTCSSTNVLACIAGFAFCE